MDIFHVNEGGKSYVYPITKILICLGLIIVLINRNSIIHIDNRVIDVIVTFLSTVTVIACIFCIYISFAEFIIIDENRAKERALSDRIIASSKKYAIDKIVTMVESNDIIDIQIVWKNKAIGIGASSDCKNYDSNFFDKLYYVDKEEFENIEDFKSALVPYLMDGTISVISIDGIKPK